MMELLIIADDFTGALDTGVQFSKQGIGTLVTTDLDTDFERLDVDVLALDAETRHIGAGAARDTVAELVRRAVRAGVRCIYKKTDSTLRGNIGAELGAMLEHCGQDELMFIPAFPKNGRVTRGGVQYVDGVPLRETAFAHDPIDPVRHSSVAEIIGLQSGVPVDCVPVGGWSAQKGIHVLDAATDEDLLRLGEALKSSGKLAALAGCAGFAEQLPRLLGLPAKPVDALPAAGNTLFVSGSVNQTSLEQVRRAGERGHRILTLTPAQLLGHAPRRDAAEQLAARLARGERVILASARGREDLSGTQAYALEHGIEPGAIAARVAQSIGEVAGRVVAADAVQNLVVFGGPDVVEQIERFLAKG